MAEIHIRFNLDLPPCESRLGDILRARDRPKPPKGPLTAPCGARTPTKAVLVHFGPKTRFLLGIIDPSLLAPPLPDTPNL